MLEYHSMLSDKCIEHMCPIENRGSLNNVENIVCHISDGITPDPIMGLYVGNVKS